MIKSLIRPSMIIFTESWLNLWLSCSASEFLDQFLINMHMISLLTLQRRLLHCRQNGRLVRWVLRLLVNDPQGITCTLNKSDGVICIQTFKNQALLSVVRATHDQPAPIKATHTSTESLNGRLYTTKDVAPHVKWNIFLSWLLCYHNLTRSFHPSILIDLMHLTIGIISVVEILTDFKGIDISLHWLGGDIVLDGGS